MNNAPAQNVDKPQFRVAEDSDPYREWFHVRVCRGRSPLRPAQNTL